MKNSNRGRKNQQQRRSQRNQNNRQQRRSQRNQRQSKQQSRSQRQSKQQRRSQRNKRQRRSQRNQRQRRSQRNLNNAQRGGFNAQHLTPQYLPVKCAGGDGSIAIPDWDSEADEGDPNKCGPLDAITGAEVGADADETLSDIGLQEQIEEVAMEMDEVKKLATAQAKLIEEGNLKLGASKEGTDEASNYSQLLEEDRSFHDYLAKFNAGTLPNKDILEFKKLLEADAVKIGDDGSGIAFIDDKARYTKMVDLYGSENLKEIQKALIDPTSLPDVATVDLDKIVTKKVTTTAAGGGG